MSTLHAFRATTSPTLVAADVTWVGPDPVPALEATIADPPNVADTRGRTTALPKLAFEGSRPRLLITRERRYNVLNRLGEGAVGEVFLAVDQDIGRKIAIKKVPSAATSRGALVRFIYEVQTIGRLEHPNIVPIHDVGQDENGDYYFVMKHVEGQTLEQIIDLLRAGDEDTHRRFGLEQRVAICRSVMEALAFAHDRGVVHRDIKPANVMVGQFGEVLLLDWGIAQSTDPADLAGGPRDGVLIGTPPYMSPEQAGRRAVDPRSDVYSLCVLMHELLTPALPRRDHRPRDAARRRPDPTDHPRDAHPPPGADRGPDGPDLVLEPRRPEGPRGGFQTVHEMIDRLDRRAAGDVEVECPVTLTKRMTLETVKATDRFVVPLLGPILRVWAWGLGRFGGRVMFALALLLFVAVLASLATLVVFATSAAMGLGFLIGVSAPS